MAPIYPAATTKKKSPYEKEKKKNIMRTGGGGRGSLGHLSQIFLGEHVLLPSLLYGNRWHLSLRNFTTTKKKGGDESATISGFFFWKGKAQAGKKGSFIFIGRDRGKTVCVCKLCRGKNKFACSVSGGEEDENPPLLSKLCISFFPPPTTLSGKSRRESLLFPTPHILHSLFYAVGATYIPRKQKGEAKISLY